jgi:hypothetical protein
MAACHTAITTSAITVTVDTAHPGAVLPTNYLGFSFEASVLESTLFDPARSNLPALLRDLGVGQLRFGGNSLDRVTAWMPNPQAPLPPWAHARVTVQDLARLGALSAATGWRVDLGLNLGHPDAAAAADEAAAAWRLLGAGLETVQIGNEPDLFAGDPALKPGGYTYGDYVADVASYRSALDAAVPHLSLSGPDTAALGWLAPYVHDQSGLSFVTHHLYALTRCGGRRPTIAQLLSSATRQRQLATVDAAVGAARPQGLPLRLDETNSASCGGQDGVSNTLASALWMVNYLLLAAQHGVAGVNVHGGLAACRGYSPLCVPGATGPVAGSSPGVDPVADKSLGAGPGEGGRLQAQPDLYSLLLVHQLEGGRWLSVNGSGATSLDAFALQMPDGSIRVVLVNAALHTTGHVVLRVPGHDGQVSTLRLTGPSLDATTRIRYGGTSVAADGTWHATATDMDRTSAVLAVDVAAASATVVILR